MSLYQDPVIKKLFDLIDANDGGAIKTYFYGDPLLIPKSDLPCLIGSKDTSEIGDASNAEDYHRMNIALVLVTDIRQDFGDTTKNIHFGDQKMYNIFEGRNSDYSLKTTSIIDILRKNTNLTNNAHIDLSVPINVNYGFTIGKRGENTWAWEAFLTVPIFYTTLRTS